jgi:hydrogenase/urease accessory protein HupE
MWCLAALFAAGVRAEAHPLSVSYAHLRSSPSTITITIRLPQDDLDLLLRLDRDLDDAVTQAELQAAAPALFAYVISHMTLHGEPQVGPPRLVRVSAWSDSNGFPYVEIETEVPAAGVRQLAWTMRLLIDLYPEHRTIADIEWSGRREQAVFQHGSTVTLDAAALTHLRTFVVLGIEHILTGYDHLLFLLALIVTAGSIRSVAVIVTAFTVSHSVTLVAAALGLVRPPAWIVEAAIALSITYVAVENMRHGAPQGRWRTAFVFGLLHGLGFANVLGELSLPAGARALSLLSFNAGVEIGQLGLVVMTWPALRLMQRSSRATAITHWISLAVAACGLFWFVERVL